MSVNKRIDELIEINQKMMQLLLALGGYIIEMDKKIDSIGMATGAAKSQEQVDAEKKPKIHVAKVVPPEVK